MVTTISNILKWSAYYLLHKLKPEKPDIIEHFYKVDPIINDKVSIWQGDITKVEADCIVNAANVSLLGGGGVDGAIHSAAGPKLREECALLNGCSIGEAKITKGYNLPAKYVIHTVGTMTKDPTELANSYRNCLQLMHGHKLKSIVFPCISTGIYGYPTEDAAHVALHQVREFLENHKEDVDRIVFCLFSEQDVLVYNELMQRYFPLIQEKGATEEDVKSFLQYVNPEERSKYEELLKPKKKVMIVKEFEINEEREMRDSNNPADASTLHSQEDGSKL